MYIVIRDLQAKIYDAFWYLVSYWMVDTYAQYIIVETKMVLGKPLVQSTQIFRSCPWGGVIIAYIFCSRHIYPRL